MRIVEIKPITVCPMCRGTGQDYSIKHSKLMPCTLCEGRSWVPLESCKGCGRPAYKWWPKIQSPILRYCGLEACLANLVKLHPAEKRKSIVESNGQRAQIAKANAKISAEEEIKEAVRRRFGPCITYGGEPIGFSC